MMPVKRVFIILMARKASGGISPNPAAGERRDAGWYTLRYRSIKDLLKEVSIFWEGTAQ
jgi:hypothetical protein